MYNVKSNKATEFINHEDILETLKYAEENKNKSALLSALILVIDNFCITCIIPRT